MTFNLIEYLRENNKRTLNVYNEDPRLLKEHYGIEQNTLAGGYGYRQVTELIQNGADAILEGDASGLKMSLNRIEVSLDNKNLFVGNTGAPLTKEGIDALILSHSSPKRGIQIGRFGIGFKSLLKLGGTIRIHSSKHGSFYFDPQKCSQLLKEKFKTNEVPHLRLAWPLDLQENFENDTIMPWAETVIQAQILNDEVFRHLKSEIEHFRSEFLLFFSVDVQIVFKTTDLTKNRSISVERNKSTFTLRDGSTTTDWIVVKKDITISDLAAKEDARDITYRNEVPITWAIPKDQHNIPKGKFWAFFETNTDCFVPGIVNAPWKLHSDRQNLMSGQWNVHLLGKAATIIADVIPTLVSNDDPGLLIDYFPRQCDTDHIAYHMVSQIEENLIIKKCFPNGNGNLKSIDELQNYPVDDFETIQLWYNLVNENAKGIYSHPLCFKNPVRVSRINNLFDKVGKKSNTEKKNIEPISKWLSHVIIENTESCHRAVLLVEMLRSRLRVSRDFANGLEFILSSDLKLRKASELYLSHPRSKSNPELVVHPELLSNPEIKRLLTSTFDFLEYREEPDHEILDGMIDKAINDGGWESVWKFIRECDLVEIEDTLISNQNNIKFKCLDGSWNYIELCTLPGNLIRKDNPEFKSIVIDTAYHKVDSEVFKLLEVSDSLNCKYTLQVKYLISILPAEWYRLSSEIYNENNTWRTFDDTELEVHKGVLLIHKITSPEIRATITTEILENQIYEFEGEVASLVDSNPIFYELIKHGIVNINDTLIPLCYFAFYPTTLIDNKIDGFEELICFNKLVNPRYIHEAKTHSNKVSPEIEYSEFWKPVIDSLFDGNPFNNRQFKSSWRSFGKVVFSSKGTFPFSEIFDKNDIYYTFSSHLAKYLSIVHPKILICQKADHEFFDKKGLKNLENSTQMNNLEIIGTVDFETEYGEFKGYLKDKFTTQIAQKIEIEFKNKLVELPAIWSKCELIISTSFRHSLTDSNILDDLLEILDSHDLITDRYEFEQSIFNDKVIRARKRVIEAETIHEKIFYAVNGDRECFIDVLQEEYPSDEYPDFDEDFYCDKESIELAQFCHNLLGSSILKKDVIHEGMKKANLDPPSVKATVEFSNFIAELGFPSDFALSSSKKRDKELLVSGPIHLPELHDFQAEVLAGIDGLLQKGSPRKRAVISLPTGGGKTRVTVQSLVELLLNKSNSKKRMALWIAQTDELCEQAVQAFRQVWQNKGSENTELRVIRYWGGQHDPRPQNIGEPVVIVASIQTLVSRSDRLPIEWITENIGAIVIDECHHSTTKSYSQLLSNLNITSTIRSKDIDEEPLILGLSATPFRTDQSETITLANKFDKYWLPQDQETLFKKLRNDEVLSEMIYTQLETGESLTNEELKELESIHTENSGLEFDRVLGLINERLAKSRPRNNKIIKAIKASAEESILLFANSKAHAEELALMLCMNDIPAAAVSGETPKSQRRYLIKQFQKGELRVLCNHSVLTTGFDAPKTNLIVISRQIFSPVRYMQIVGRGLRGPKNGGTELCRILTVLDNLGRFKQRHAYHYCKSYYQSTLE